MLNNLTVSFNLHQLLGADFDPRRTKAYVTTNVESGTLMDTDTGEIRLGDQAVTINLDGTGTWTTWEPGADGNPTSWQETLVVDYPRTGQRDRKRRSFGPYTLASTTRTVTNKALTSNVATLTTSAPHGLAVGHVVTVTGVDATFNGTYTLTAVTTTTLSYAKAAADVASAAATGTVTSPNVRLVELEEEQAVPAEYLTTVTTQLATYTTAAQGYAASAAGSVSLVAWAPATAYTAGDVRQAPDGTTVRRNANGTSGASFDVTEQAAWTAIAAVSGTMEQVALSATFVPQDANAYNAKHYGAAGNNTADDTAAIQEAIDAANAAGGGTVFLPPGRYIITQLVIKEGVHLTGPARSYGGSTAPFPATLFQKSGSNADMVIPEGDGAGYCKPFGFSYVTLVGHASSTGGSGFATRNAAGTSTYKWQDNCFMHQVQVRGFADDGFFIGGGSAVMNISDLAALWCGGYGVHIRGSVATDELQAVFLVNISGDGNSGGAALCIENVKPEYAVAITNLKSEQRVNAIRDPAGPPVQVNALRLINVGGFVTINGLQHISSSANLVKPGDAIRVSGSPLPVVNWSAVKVRDNFTGQVGATPVLLNDTVRSKTIPLNVITGVYGDSTDVRHMDYASTSRYWWGRANDHTKPAPAGPEFSLNGDTPVYVLNRDAEAADAKLWGLGAHSGGAFEIRMYGDDGTTGDRPLRIGRTGKTSTTMGFFGVTPVTRPAAITQTYSTAARTNPAYTTDDESVAYTGSPADAASTAKLADLNALRVAYVNLEADHLALKKLLNAVIDDLQALGFSQ